MLRPAALASGCSSASAPHLDTGWGWRMEWRKAGPKSAWPGPGTAHSRASRLSELSKGQADQRAFWTARTAGECREEGSRTRHALLGFLRQRVQALPFLR